MRANTLTFFRQTDRQTRTRNARIRSLPSHRFTGGGEEQQQEEGEEEEG